MVCETFAHGDSFIHRLDPRARVAAVAALAIVLIWVVSWTPAIAALALAVWLAAKAMLPIGPLARRLRNVNIFMLMLVLLVPLRFNGWSFLRPGWVTYSREGLDLALLMVVRVNALVLAATALVSTMEFSTLGHALGALRVPQGLVHLLMFTVRYVDLLHHEYNRLRAAMRTRCFRARFNRHTWRSLGQLAGMLLVRSFDRSERVMAAMKCRGFTGTFPSLHRMAWNEEDSKFCVFGGLVLAGLVALAVWT